MPHPSPKAITARVNRRRRLALGLMLGVVAVVVWRFSAVMLRRAATRALEESGWTIVYEQAPASSSAILDRITAQLGQAGTLLAGMFGHEPDIVEVRIADMQSESSPDADLSLLRQLPKLSRLSVQRQALSADDIEAIGSAGSLVELTVASDALTDDSLEALAGLSNLRRLTVVSQRVTDAGVSHLTGIRTLRFLDLQSTRAGGAGIEAFSRLESLALGPWTRNEDLQSVSRLPRLRELLLTDSRIGDDGFRQLGSLQSLEVLYLSGPNAVTDEGLAVLGELDQLTQLTLHGQHFTFAGLKSLTDSESLEQVELRGRELDDAGLDAFRPPTSLKVLRLDYTSISDAGFDRFERRHPKVDLWR